jgi:hypothetical protein
MEGIDARMAMDAAETWRDCFSKWPPEIARRGVLVTTFGEQIPFDSFAASPTLLLIERRSPDTMGGRTVLISYQSVSAVKIVDVVKAKTFAPMGFIPPPPSPQK